MKHKFTVKTMGDNIRRARRNRIPSMSLDALAELSGVTRVTINNIELGKLPQPGIGTIVQIAQALDVPIGMLIGEEPMSDADVKALGILRSLIEDRNRK